MGMPIDSRRLKPGELCRLLNSTPLGPGLGEVKGEVQRRFQGRKGAIQVVEAKAADKMIEHQVAAHLRRHRRHFEQKSC